MSNYFKQIADDLLGIAFLPNDQRNNALNDLSFILMDVSDDDIPKEQKDLINTIIKDMIAENPSGGAIDTTPKKPAKTITAKKETATVVLKNLVEIPDKLKTIEFNSKVKDFPLPIQKLWLQRQKEAGNALNVNLVFDDIAQLGGINFDKTQEGLDFWIELKNGNFIPFKEKYGKYGEFVVVDDDVFDYINQATSSQTSTQDDSVYDIYALPIVDNNPYLMPISLVKFFPIPIQKLFLNEQWYAGNPFNVDVMISATKSQGGFDLDKSLFSEQLWNNIQNGNFEEFKRAFGKNGEEVDINLRKKDAINDWLKNYYSAQPSQTSTQNLAVLPDSVSFASSNSDVISKLPIVVQKLFVQRQKDAGNDLNVNIPFNNKSMGAFNWSDTQEGYTFWNNISFDGDLKNFKEKYGDSGEKLVVDADVEDFINKLYPFATQSISQANASEIISREYGTLIPDNEPYINIASVIEAFPKPIQKLILQRQKNQKKPFSITTKLYSSSFDFATTVEGTAFWNKTNSGIFIPFKEKYGNYGEKLVVDTDVADYFDTMYPSWSNKDYRNNSGELPVKIIVSGLNPFIYEFPDVVQKVIKVRTEQQGNVFDSSKAIKAGNKSEGFVWASTPEGKDFWQEVSKGNLRDFIIHFERHGNTAVELEQEWEKSKQGNAITTQSASKVILDKVTLRVKF